MTIKVLSKEELRQMQHKLNEQFGITQVPQQIIQIGKERIRLYTGDLTNSEIQNLSKITHIEGIGLYIAKEEREELRLSIEGTQILGIQATKNIFHLNDEQLKTWMEGADLQIQTGLKGIFIMKYKDYYIGCSKISENKISNFIPKGRRIKVH